MAYFSLNTIFRCFSMFRYQTEKYFHRKFKTFYVMLLRKMEKSVAFVKSKLSLRGYFFQNIKPKEIKVSFKNQQAEGKFPAARGRH